MVVGGDPMPDSVELVRVELSSSDLECITPANHPTEVRYDAAAILNGIPTVCGGPDFSPGNYFACKISEAGFFGTFNEIFRLLSI